MSTATKKNFTFDANCFRCNERYFPKLVDLLFQKGVKRFVVYKSYDGSDDRVISLEEAIQMKAKNSYRFNHGLSPASWLEERESKLWK